MGTNLFVGGDGVFMSRDKGISWTATGPNGVYVTAPVVSGSNLFAGTYSRGVFLSTDNGTNWTRTNMPMVDVRTLAVSGINLFAGTYYGGGVYLSTNNGTSWSDVSSGLTTTKISALVVSGTNLFAGTVDAGVWSRPLSDFGLSDVAVTKQAQSTVECYPNPFYESATIRFRSTDRGSVDVRIVNLLGAEVATIFNGELDAGEHAFKWYAQGMQLGMYECVIQMYECVSRTNSRAEHLPILLLR